MANEITDRVGEQIESRITEQKSRAADTLSGVADSLLLSSQQLRERHEDNASQYLERAAGQVERFANYLHTADVNQTIDTVEDFARRQPGAFVASAFAVGFLASRFLKSSRQSHTQLIRYEGDGVRPDSGPTDTLDYPRTARQTSRPAAENWRTTGYSASDRGV